MSASRYQNDFYAAFVRSSQRIEIPLRNLELGVEQGAVYIDG
jgi:hypothetical protein